MELASAITILCASIIPLNLARRTRTLKRPWFAVSALLGGALLTHGLYHLFSFLGGGFVKTAFEFTSALLLYLLSSYYLLLRRKVGHEH